MEKRGQGGDKEPQLPLKVEISDVIYAHARN
jgi:hypothetical protein